MDFVHENFNAGKAVKQWKDIEEENTVMLARSFLKLCQYHHLIPTILNIETLAKFMEQTLPPITNAENEFYATEKLRKLYDDDKTNYQNTFMPEYDANGELTEPALHFHEFLYLLGLIAYRCIDSKESI